MHAACQPAGPGIGHTSTVWGLAFSADGERMVSCSADCTLHIWTTPTATGQPCAIAHADRLGAAASSLSAAGVLPRWRLQSAIQGHHKRAVFSVDWAKSGAIATGGQQTSAWRWLMAT